jgi:hypothetical protein
MTIVVCDVQSEDTKPQCLFWRKLNTIVEKKRMGMPMFKGFTADSVQANWNVVWIVYEIGGPMVKMVDKKWTCFFHWT